MTSAESRLPEQRRTTVRLSAVPAGGMAALLPTDVSVCDATDEGFDGNRLLGVAPVVGENAALAAELSALGPAAAGRGKEFAQARACAHSALAALDAPVVPILIGTGGEPVWPVDVVGSITHCGYYRAAAVAPASSFLAIGIDAERNIPLGPGAGGAVLTDRERLYLRVLPRWSNWETLSFSAKESVFKAWFAVTGGRLNFGDVCLDLRPDRNNPRSGGFSAHVSDNTAGMQAMTAVHGIGGVIGRYALGPRLLLTAVTIRRRNR